MSLSDENKVTKRNEVNRRLTFLEMDENFQQLKYAIVDIQALEEAITQFVTTSVYNNKMDSIDGLIATLQNSIITAVSQDVFNVLEARVTSLEARVSALE